VKYLILAVVVVALVWLWRHQRDRDARDAAEEAAEASAKAAKRKTKSPEPPHDIVACPVCGLHLPKRDAVPGTLALYCSADHQRQAEP